MPPARPSRIPPSRQDILDEGARAFAEREGGEGDRSGYVPTQPGAAPVPPPIVEVVALGDRLYLRHGGQLWRLNHPTAGWAMTPTQVTWAAKGWYTPLMAAFVAACAKAGVAPRHSYAEGRPNATASNLVPPCQPRADVAG